MAHTLPPPPIQDLKEWPHSAQEWLRKVWLILSNNINSQGTSVVSAGSLILGTDGNYFQIVNSTQINLLSSASINSGNQVILKFNSNPIVKNNQIPIGVFKPLILQGAADFHTAKNNTLSLVYDAIDQVWYETSRKT